MFNTLVLCEGSDTIWNKFNGFDHFTQYFSCLIKNCLTNTKILNLDQFWRESWEFSLERIESGEKFLQNCEWSTGKVNVNSVDGEGELSNKDNSDPVQHQGKGYFKVTILRINWGNFVWFYRCIDVCSTIASIHYTLWQHKI